MLRKVPKMEINEKIRMLREFNHFSQEEMAEKLNISTTGYAKIERGERGINIARLEQIAAVLDVDTHDLIPLSDGNSAYLVIKGDNNQANGIVYNNKEELQIEIEKLKLMLKHKDELLEQQNRELEMLKDMLAFLKQTQLNT